MDEGLAVVDGPTLVLEALAADVVVDHVVVEGGADPVPAVVAAARAAGVDVHAVPPGTLAAVLDVVTPQPAVAVIALPTPAWPVTPVPDLVVALDGVADPGNVGTLIRTAEAAGAGAVLTGPGCADPWAPKVVRAAAGSSLRVPVVAIDDLAAELVRLGGSGVRVVGAAMAGTPYDEVDLTGPLALVLGSEAHGLSAPVAEVVHQVASIPMAGPVESLNVATAGAVLAFESARRRRRAGPSPDAGGVP